MTRRNRNRIFIWISDKGMYLLFISAFINFWWGKFDLKSINTQLGFTLVALGFAACAISLSFSSEEKMKALTNMSFIEKHAMMQEYIEEFNKNYFNGVKKCKLDFEASIEVKEWASLERKEEYIKDLIKLIEIRLNPSLKQNEQIIDETLIDIIDKAVNSKIPTKEQIKRLEELRELLKRKNN